MYSVWYPKKIEATFFYQFRSSHRRCSMIKGVLRNFAEFTDLLNKVAGLRPETLLKSSLWHRCFPVIFAN